MNSISISALITAYLLSGVGYLRPFLPIDQIKYGYIMDSLMSVFTVSFIDFFVAYFHTLL